MKILTDHFPDLTSEQCERFERLEMLYCEWNTKINVISRKDIDGFNMRHLLHSLGIAKVQKFLPQSSVLDAGTGGGFPGIPLSILFPETQFYLIDSIGKKIAVVQAVVESLGLNNVQAVQMRIEAFDKEVDFAVSRAVTQMDQFVPWVKDVISKKHRHLRRNGILCLKGGDLTEELNSFPKAQIFNLHEAFSDSFFETKKVVYLPF